MTMITPSYLGETIEYSSLHACRSTLEDPTDRREERQRVRPQRRGGLQLPRKRQARARKKRRLRNSKQRGGRVALRTAGEMPALRYERFD